MLNQFTKWVHWKDRIELAGLTYPGIYTIAISESDIAGTSFSWIPEIAYVGMTNAKGGLKSRLNQFDVTIKGGRGHGGAHRFRFRHPNYDSLIQNLYASVRAFPCRVTSESPDDLRVMGDVTRVG